MCKPYLKSEHALRSICRSIINVSGVTSKQFLCYPWFHKTIVSKWAHPLFKQAACMFVK